MTVIAFNPSSLPSERLGFGRKRHPVDNHTPAGWRLFSPFRLLSRRKQSRPADFPIPGQVSRDGGAPEVFSKDEIFSRQPREIEPDLTDLSYAPSTELVAEINRLDDLALLLRSITWGEMQELGAGIGQTGGGGEISQLEFPAALHLWAMERQP